MTLDTVWNCFRTDLSEQFSQPFGSVSESDSVHDQSQSVSKWVKSQSFSHGQSVSLSVSQAVG